jgi:hypothetical protein
MALAQMTYRLLFAGFGASLALVGTLPAFAAQPRKAVQQEVYSATESETDEPAAPALPLTVARPKQAAGIAKPNQTAPSKIAPKLPDSALSYDLVPSDQVDPLAKRLALVETLIRRYSRAYDYRTHTVRDLQMILAKLEAANAAPAQLAAPAPKPRAMLETAPAARSALPTPSEDDEVNGGGENPHNTDE